jgi:hypothetical protein
VTVPVADREEAERNEQERQENNVPGGEGKDHNGDGYPDGE